jgi:hypothetical protein
MTMKGPNLHSPDYPANQPAIYCRQCGYDLRALSVPRCPECGHPFNHGNPRTYCRSPITPWRRFVGRIGISLFSLFVMLTLLWAWFYMGWRCEQKARASLDPVVCVGYAPLVPPQLRACFGPVGFVFDRVDEVSSVTNDRDMLTLAQFRHLRRITVCDVHVTDLAPLARLNKLEKIVLWSTGVSDLRPLAGHANLTSLDVIGSPITDLSPLVELTSLRELRLTKRSITDKQVEVLQKAIPRCVISLE